MEKEKTDTALSGWKNRLAEITRQLKKAWKFANNYNLLEKAKEIRIPPSVKTLGMAVLLSIESLATKANTAENNSRDRNTDNSEIKTNPDDDNKHTATVEYAAVAIANDASSNAKATFKSYHGNYYNQICNGSPCWLASTYETKGAGIGKNPSSIATWNDKGNYRGINQISPSHAKKFLNWLGDKEEFKEVYQALKTGGIGKANWQQVAKKMEHPMTEAFENYMVEVYNPENFKFIQDELNKSGIKASVRKLHPAILSAMHQIMVERPSSRTKIASKITKFMETHHGDEQKLNSEEFIKTLIHNDAVEKKAIKLFHDTTIVWKKAQFASLVSQVVPENDDNRSWFDLQAEAQQKKDQNLKRETIAQEAPQIAHQQMNERFKETIAQLGNGVTEIGKISNLEELRNARAKTTKRKSKKEKVSKETILFNDRLLNRKKGSSRS